MQRNLATTMALIDWQRAKAATKDARPGVLSIQSHSELAVLAWGTYSTLSGGNPADDLAVIIGCAALHEAITWSSPSLGPVAAQIAQGLRTTDMLDAVHATRQYASDNVDEDIFEHLEWALAPRLRDLMIPADLTATQTAVLLDAAFLRLNADDSDQVAERVVTSLPDAQLTALLQRLSDPGDFWTWFSLTQRRVMLMALDRVPDEVQRSVEDLPVALTHAWTLRGLSKRRVDDRTLRREWLRGLVGLPIGDVPSEP